MKAKLTVNGKELEVDIADEQAKALTESKKTGFERVERGKRYSYIYHAVSYDEIERGHEFDDMRFSRGTYFSNDNLSADYTRVIALFLALSQWQALNDKPITRGAWFEITNKYEKVEPTCANTYRFGIIRFSSYEKAIEAIEVFRSDLEWYFKEFKPRLDM